MHHWDTCASKLVCLAADAEHASFDIIAIFHYSYMQNDSKGYSQGIEACMLQGGPYKGVGN